MSSGVQVQAEPQRSIESLEKASGKVPKLQFKYRLITSELERKATPLPKPTVTPSPHTGKF